MTTRCAESGSSALHAIAEDRIPRWAVRIRTVLDESSLMRRRYVRLCLTSALILGTLAIGAAPPSSAATDVSPGTFSRVSSGVALIKSYGCGGKGLGQGTGFLVGSSVVMTARHVIQGACRLRIRVGGETFSAVRAVSWRGGGASASAADIATIKLDHASTGFVFRVRSSRVALGTNLGMVGYPLGNRLSLNQGKIIARGKEHGAPLLAVRMLGAEGASGSPFIDNDGRVVGILQRGLGSEDVLGQRTAGVLVGLDLVRWWGPRARLDLCHAYANGGIAGCPGATRPPPPPPTSETVKVVAARVSSTENGSPQSSFESAPEVVVWLGVDFAAATRVKHVLDVYALGPSGERVEGCGGNIGVDWEGFTCDVHLNSPSPGSWQVTYLIDGRQRAVGFQVTSPTPPPTATPHIQQCWSQYSGGSTSNWNPSSATTTYSGSDILARGATNFAAIAQMSPVPTSDIVGGVTLTLIQPNGQVFGTGTVSNWQAGYSLYGFDFRATWTDGSLFFQHPELTGQGTWTFQWKGPDGQICNNAITIT